MAQAIQPIANTYKKPMISYASSASDLSSAPYFLRTVPSNELISESIIDTLFSMKIFDNVGLIYSNEAYGIDGFNMVRKLAAKKGIQIGKVATLPFSTGDAVDYLPSLQSVKQANVSAIIAYTIRTINFTLLLDQRVEAGLSDTIWIFAQSFASVYTQYESILNRRSQKLIYVDQDKPDWINDKFLVQKYGSNNFHLYCGFAYDAILAYGYAITSMINSGQDIYNPQLLLNAIKAVDFLGVTGRVRLNSMGDRAIVSIVIANIIGRDLIRIARWHSERAIKWQTAPIVPGRTMTLKEIIPRAIRTENRWNIIPEYGIVPQPRDGHSIVVFPEAETMILFGGVSDDKTLRNDIWVYDFKAKQWYRQLALEAYQPSPRKEQVAWYVYCYMVFMFTGPTKRICLYLVVLMDIHLPMVTSIAATITYIDRTLAV